MKNNVIAVPLTPCQREPTDSPGGSPPTPGKDGTNIVNQSDIHHCRDREREHSTRHLATSPGNVRIDGGGGTIHERLSVWKRLESGKLALPRRPSERICRVEFAIRRDCRARRNGYAYAVPRGTGRPGLTESLTSSNCCMGLYGVVQFPPHDGRGFVRRNEDDNTSRASRRPVFRRAEGAT